LLDLAVTRYTNFSEVEDYCKRTSGKLSVLCSKVMGYHHSNTLKYAENLGIALELTYRLRYLRRDVQQGRLYFPQEDLEKFKVSEQTLFGGQWDDRVQSLCKYQMARIRTYYHQAFKCLNPADCPLQESGLVRSQLALATLQEIEKDGYQLFYHHITLPSWRKWWITGRTRWLVKKGCQLTYTLSE
jgi:phytoene synthase